LRFPFRGGKPRPPRRRPTQAPTGLQATGISTTEIRLTWTNHSVSATAIRIQRSPDGIGSWADLSPATYPPTTAALTDSGLTPNTPYWYRVRAEGPSGPSNWSNVDDGRTNAASSGGATLLTSFALTNTTATPTASRTLYPCGHPIVAGDIPAGSRARLTWTPTGGTESGALPVQQDVMVSRPDDSLRFLGLKMALPSVAASGSGTVNVYSEPGDPIAAIPGGRTPAAIALDLENGVFPGSGGGSFAVVFSKLTRGHESYTVGAAGTGYTTADDIAFSGGTGGTAPPAAYTGFTVDGSGGITAVKAMAPDPRYDPTAAVPTTTPASTTGSGGAITFHHPPIDGSGSFVWNLADQLAFFGSVDARGRKRCELIESGPLCVLFRCWGPIKDTVSGLDHPHLDVTGWYRCWLAADGAIDRVEFAHAPHNGWIEDLNGGSVKADLQIADVSVTLAGTPIAGQSWPSMRIPIYSEHLLVNLDLTNFHTGGSHWTSGHPTLHAAFDARYQCRSLVVPPYEMDRYATLPIRPAADASPCGYRPGANLIPPTSGGLSSSLAGRADVKPNDGGGHDGLGLMPLWSVRALHTQEIGYVLSDLATALYGMQLPDRWKDPKTGRLAWVKSDFTPADSSNAGMGAGRPTSKFITGVSTAVTTDFKLVNPASGFANGDYTDGYGGWVPQTGWNSTHWQSYAYHAYIRTAQPWFLETIKLHAANPTVAWMPAGKDADNTTSEISGNNRDLLLPDGTTLHARFIGQVSTRAEGWAWKLLGQCLAVMPDDAIERPYIQALFDGNADGAGKLLAYATASVPNFIECGHWVFPDPTHGADASHPAYMGSDWMEDYLIHGVLFSYLALGRPSNLDSFVAHLGRNMRLRCGGVAGGPGSWGAIAFKRDHGSGNGWGHFSAAEMAHYHKFNGVLMDAATGYLHGGGTILTTTVIENQTVWPIEVGDKVMLAPYLSGDGGKAQPIAASGTSNGATVALAYRTWYYVASVDAGNDRITISPNADLSHPFTAFSSSITGVGVGLNVRKAVQPTPAPSTPGSIVAYNFAEGSAGDGLPVTGGAMKLLVLAGIIDPAEDAYQNLLGASGRLTYARINRWSNGNKDYDTYPEWDMAESV
jgi:hypothetical protein